MNRITPVLISLLFVLTACGGGGGGDDNGDNGGGGGTTDTAVRLTSVVLYDASKNTLADADVTFSDSQTTGGRVAHKTAATALRTDNSGNFTIPDGLPPGTYLMTVTKAGVSSTTKIRVSAENSTASAKTIVPLTSGDGGTTWENIADNVILGAITGKITDLSGNALSGATVSLSGGEATNGAVATVVTGNDGQYSLLINANISLLNALLNSTLNVTKPGYQKYALSGFQVVNGTNVTGLNFLLSEDTSGGATVLWQETFESNSSTVNDWTVNQLAGDNINNTWHLHSSGLGIVNQAYTDGYVQLATGDTSSGAVPDPSQGSQAYWYGSAQSTDNSTVFGAIQGNFLDNQEESFAFELDGGTSNSLDGWNEGELISPSIDLTSVSASTPVSLVFDTFWEIESVNPNSSGFDVMIVEYSLDDGATWETTQARLNPLSDPQDTVERAPIPYSNTGYNSPPAWVQQEAIPLVGVQGETIRLRFTFSTEDNLYNGFRGWLIDNVIVQEGEGSFPVYDGTFGDYDGYGFGYFYVNYDPETYQSLVTPASYDPVTYELVYLDSGNTTFTAEVSYSDDMGAGSFVLKLVTIDYETYATTVVDESAPIAYSATSGAEGTATLSATLNVPTGTDYVELWIEMTDSEGYVYEYPVEFYEVAL